MAIVKTKREGKTFIVENFREVRSNINQFFSRMNVITILMIFAAIFSPVLWFFFFFLIFLLFNIQIWDRYFKYKPLLSYYLREFSCVAADNGVHVFSNFGYTVDKETEWDTHLEKLQSFELPDDAKDEDLKEYAETLAKEMKKVQRKEKWRQFGVGKDIATRHLLFIGTTGAGKTETLMSWLNDVLKIENSGGCIFIDGKADTKMHAKLSWLLEKHNRMTSFYTISFLKADKMPATNTYNPILTMPPFKGVAFMSSLLPGTEGSGNGDYFKNRGIAMLTVPLSALRIRNEFYKEPFSLAILQSSTSTINMSILFFLFYGMVREQNDFFEEKIKTDKKVRELWQEAKDKSVAVHHDVQYYEKILNYVTQYNPSAKKDVEDIIGYEFKLFFQAFSMPFQMGRMYMGEISPDWLLEANAIGEALYVYALNFENKHFGVTYPNPVSIEDVRRWLNKIADDSLISKITSDPLFKGDGGDKRRMVERIKQGLGMDPNAAVTLESLQEQEKMQHGYARQQWTSTFNSFNEFPNVFGSPFPDVDMKDIMKNNKVLYVLLPILELGDDKSKILGKMVIRDIQEAGSVTLGGEKINVTPTQDTLYKDKITPKPLSLVVADEYGYYRVEGNEMAAILAQFRSLNMSAVLSLQNVAGLGNDEVTNTTLANTAKFVLKSYDKEIREFVDTQIGEGEFIEVQRYYDHDKNIKESLSGNIEIKKEKTFDTSILGDLMYGCGLFICNSKPVIVQSYYFGGQSTEPYIASMERYIVNK